MARWSPVSDDLDAEVYEDPSKEDAYELIDALADNPDEYAVRAELKNGHVLWTVMGDTLRQVNLNLETANERNGSNAAFYIAQRGRAELVSLDDAPKDVREAREGRQPGQEGLDAF